MLVLSSNGVFTYEPLRSNGDRSKFAVEDHSNRCTVLVNKFATIEYGRTPFVLALLDCGFYWGNLPLG